MKNYTWLLTKLYKGEVRTVKYLSQKNKADAEKTTSCSVGVLSGRPDPVLCPDRLVLGACALG